MPGILTSHRRAYAKWVGRLNEHLKVRFVAPKNLARFISVRRSKKSLD